MHKTLDNDAFDPIHLDIAFHRLQPEMLLQTIRQSMDPVRKSVYENASGNQIQTPGYVDASSSRWAEKTYVHYALANSGRYRTDDEVRLMSSHFTQRTKHEGRDDSVFEILRRYAQRLLTTDGAEPLCRYERVLRWRKLTLSLGQDLFTTAYLAAEDIKHNRVRHNFVWPAIINTDNKRLGQIIAQGVSENHFHLTGSTRMLSLSWVCMMNHPKRIYTFFQDKTVAEHFSERLNLAISGNPNEQLMPWDKLVLLAAYLRAILFMRCLGLKEKAQVEKCFFRYFDTTPIQSPYVTALVGQLRHSYGAQIPQQNGRAKVLDYVLTIDLEACFKSHNRLLAGERHFLYLCFRKCFTCDFSDIEKDLFYLYLLIHNQFRSEMIQVNERVGFQNFARYQDRKGFFWESMPEYWDESIRLAVNATLQNGAVRALEARMCPAKSPGEQMARIISTDRSYGFAETGKSLNQKQMDILTDSPLFYVLHFPKNRKEICKVSTSSERVSAMAYPRNSKVRRDTEIQAKSLAKALENSPYLRKRIRGIDACSNEIGCRPETFATAFRFLRCGIPCNNNILNSAQDNEVHLGATYHAGEDFLDIIDGLRAIDEAFLFLELRRGDRLGHALALGVKPADYYRLKKGNLVLQQQDLLDNLIWLLYRTLEYGVDMPLSIREKLELDAKELMHYIGYDTTLYTLANYYQSWQLRGDHPRLYSGKPRCDHYIDCYDRVSCDTCPNRRTTQGFYSFGYIQKGRFENFYEQKDQKLKRYRQDEKIRTLCWLYHFDPDIKKKGCEVISYKINPNIIPVIESLQNQMQHCLMTNGISIECNPSSNVLIGSFQKYRDHPMFRFNRHGIRVPQWEHEPSAGLCVSINTDDQGVFDTSLESEYAYVARSLERELDDEGQRLNSNDAIYAYLDHIRRLGNSQTFHHKNKDLFFSKEQEYQSFVERLCSEGDTYLEKNLNNLN